MYQTLINQVESCREETSRAIGERILMKWNFSQSQKIKLHGIRGVWYDSTMPRYSFSFQLVKYKHSGYKSSGCFILAKDNPF